MLMAWILHEHGMICIATSNQISNWRSFEKRVIFDLLFKYFSHQGNNTKIISAHISLTYIHVFCSPCWLFCLTILQKIHHVWFLFGENPCVNSYSSHFGAINKSQNSEQNLSWNVYYWYLNIYTNAKFIVICKPRTLNDGRWRLSSIQKTLKALLFSSSHFAFYR